MSTFVLALPSGWPRPSQMLLPTISRAKICAMQMTRFQMMAWNRQKCGNFWIGHDGLAHYIALQAHDRCCDYPFARKTFEVYLFAITLFYDVWSKLQRQSRLKIFHIQGRGLLRFFKTLSLSSLKFWTRWHCSNTPSFNKAHWVGSAFLDPSKFETRSQKPLNGF